METILEFMSKDHDRLDAIFGKFSKVKGADLGEAKKLFSEFESDLLRHIVWEEDLLFPAFEEKTGMSNSGPTFVMRGEHQQIKEYLVRIRTRLEDGNSKTDELETGLLGVLKPHNDKEESILYPWIDQALSAPESEQLLGKILNSVG